MGAGRRRVWWACLESWQLLGCWLGRQFVWMIVFVLGHDGFNDGAVHHDDQRYLLIKWPQASFQTTGVDRLERDMVCAILVGNKQQKSRGVPLPAILFRHHGVPHS